MCFLGDREGAHDVSVSVKAGPDFLEEAVELVGAGDFSVGVEAGAAADDRSIELAELIADSS